MTFHQRAILAMALLAKQPPVTLEQARAQCLWMKVISSNKNKESAIKNLLKLYDENSTEKQIESEYNRLTYIHKEYMEAQTTNPNNGNFQKAMIKIANPTWTAEQIQAEYEKQQKQKEETGDCEMCSG